MTDLTVNGDLFVDGVLNAAVASADRPASHSHFAIPLFDEFTPHFARS